MATVAIILTASNPQITWYYGSGTTKLSDCCRLGCCAWLMSRQFYRVSIQLPLHAKIVSSCTGTFISTQTLPEEDYGDHVLPNSYILFFCLTSELWYILSREHLLHVLGTVLNVFAECFVYFRALGWDCFLHVFCNISLWTLVIDRLQLHPFNASRLHLNDSKNDLLANSIISYNFMESLWFKLKILLCSCTKDNRIKFAFNCVTFDKPHISPLMLIWMLKHMFHLFRDNVLKLNRYFCKYWLALR